MPQSYTSHIPAQEPLAVTYDDLVARVRRLDQLSCGLGLELTLIEKADDPMLFMERKAYLAAMVNVLRAIEDARVTLATACQQLNASL
jgi:hypothetical protein